MFGSGTSAPQAKFADTIISKCQGTDNNCKSDEEIEEFFSQHILNLMFSQSK